MFAGKSGIWGVAKGVDLAMDDRDMSLAVFVGEPWLIWFGADLTLTAVETKPTPLGEADYCSTPDGALI